jgi:hypothetical protein
MKVGYWHIAAVSQRGAMSAACGRRNAGAGVGGKFGPRAAVGQVEISHRNGALT